MLKVQADTSKIEHRFDHMGRQLTELPLQIDAGVIAWQRDDMHRQYPTADWVEEHRTVEIDIWPRSRKSSKHRPTGRPRGRPRGGTNVPGMVRPKQARLPGGRPILRQVLFEQLRARMRDLLGSVTWA